MSMYLPRIDDYILFEPDQLADVSPPGKRQKKRRVSNTRRKFSYERQRQTDDDKLHEAVPHARKHSGTEASQSSHTEHNPQETKLFAPLSRNDGPPSSSVVPLPDIRITNGHAQPAGFTDLADDHLAMTLDENALREARIRRVKFLQDEDAETEHSPQKTGRRKKGRLKRQNSLGRLFRHIDKSRPTTVSELDERQLQTREQIRRKFSQAIKAVMTICKLASIMIKKSEEPSAMLKTFTDMIDSNNFTENLKNQGLSFDPSYFKANKEISISNEVKSILNMPPASRSQEQIQTAMYGLQSLPSFAEYPLHMQEKLAKVAWYEVVPPKRTIIRQGHYAENFYFILSGRAVVTILIRDPKTNESQVRTANFMRKGTSFGELALLHHSRRTATVTSQDTVQLLSIGREDFFDIFMSRQGSDEVPEHIRFISQLDFMKGWPLERLLERPEHCLLNFFKRNMVIVKDSKESDWIYVIKSGSCEVLKQLNGVTPRLGIRKHEATLDESFHLPHTGTSIRGPKVDTGLQRPRPQSNRSPPGSLLTTEDEDYFHLWGLAGTGRNSTQSSRSSPKTPIGGTSATPKATSLNNKRYSKESYSDKPLTGRPHFELKTPAASSPRVSPLRLSGPRKQRPSSDSPTGSKPRSVPGSDVPRPPGTPPPVFVRVSTQKPRDIFGLEQIRFHGNLDAQQTSVSLVSRGAECIMLSKDFFRRHANEMVKKNLQELVRPYPDEDTFQDSLQTKADWDLFKHTLIEDITSPPVI
ncbi:cyclic nucleotide-binding domain-containing protein 2-like isoform X2 [Littorina saxatilis]|uniref:Cyclic nucleotide-binding domain-containing protein n=1 Tax=Littorina saxatilis TaxID=31220 RepID=A0AAN9BTD6_9CAEN